MGCCCTEDIKVLLVGKDWIRVQQILKQKEDMSYRLQRKNKAILIGVLKCKNCGHNLIARMSKNDNGNRFYYVCELKDRSHRGKCNIKNVNGNELDKIVLEEIKKLVTTKSEIYCRLKKIATTVDEEDERKSLEIKRLKEQYRKNDRDVESYLEKIKYVDPKLVRDISDKIVELRNSNEKIKDELENLSIEKNEIYDKDIAKILVDLLENFNNKFYELKVEQQRRMIQLLIENVITDGENVTINFLGSSKNGVDPTLQIGNDWK